MIIGRVRCTFSKLNRIISQNSLKSGIIAHPASFVPRDKSLDYTSFHYLVRAISSQPLASRGQGLLIEIYLHVRLYENYEVEKAFRF